jgi:muconolactone delta-isomerase
VEFLVKFQTHIPDGVPDAEVSARYAAEAAASAQRPGLGLGKLRLGLPGEVFGPLLG